MRFRGWAALAVVAVATVCAVACTVDELSLVGKACPCVSGFRCDPSTNRCVFDATATDGGVVVPHPTFRISRLAPAWVTRSSVRWTWEVIGNPDAFGEYRLITGETEDSVRLRDSNALVFDPRINPELGTFGERSSSSPDAPTNASTVVDRQTGSVAFARLIVLDKGGVETLGDVVSAPLGQPTSRTTLFADKLDEGRPTTSDLKFVVKRDCYYPANASAACLELASIACGTATTCPLELGIVGLDTKSVSGMTKATFENAYVELAARGREGVSNRQDGANRDLSDVVLTIGIAPSCRVDGNPCRFRANKIWSFRPGGAAYRLVQIPLRVLQLETPSGPGRALTFEDLESNGLRIQGLAVVGEWSANGAIDLDEFALRW